MKYTGSVNKFKDLKQIKIEESFKMEKAIGKAIKIMRVKEELRQSDLSEKTGLNQATIANMEQGKALSVKNLILVANAFEIPLSDLIILAEDMQ